MARRGLSLLLLVAICLAANVYAASTPKSPKPPPKQKPPRPPPSPPKPRSPRPPPKASPRSPPPKALSPPPVAEDGTVNVTVQVSGRVSIFDVHMSAARDPREAVAAAAAANLAANGAPDLIAMLYDHVGAEAGQPDEGPNAPKPTVTLRVNFGEQVYSLTPGDVVATNLTFTVPAKIAQGLALDTPSASPPGLSGGQRRTRRMLLGFHGTRRHLSEVVKLQDLLASQAGLAYTQPRATDVETLEQQAAHDLIITNGVPQQMTSITFNFRSTACGINSQMDHGKLLQYWFDNGDSAPIVASMERYFNTCSYGLLTFPRDKNLVFTLDVPCTGTTAKGPYNLRSGFGNGANLDNELYGLVELGKAFLKANYPTVYNQWSTYRRKIMLYPFNAINQYAYWAGLARMSCTPDDDCQTWINLYDYASSYKISQEIVFQELGHNIGLPHSWRYWDQKPWSNITLRDGLIWGEYDDLTCPMGSGMAYTNATLNFVCTNAPQSYKAGWTQPMPGGQVTFASLQPGQTYNFKVPAMVRTRQNFLRIILNATSTFAAANDTTKPEHALYVSYRIRPWQFGTYDSGLDQAYNARVWVHEYNETYNGQPGRLKIPPTLMALLTEDLEYDNVTKTYVPPKPPAFERGVGPTFTLNVGSPTEGLRLKVLRRTRDEATVTLCRYRVTRETGALCFDGLDNDCDGLPDDMDPDCATSLG